MLYSTNIFHLKSVSVIFTRVDHWKNSDTIFTSLFNQKVNCGRKTWHRFTNYSTRTTFYKLLNMHHLFVSSWTYKIQIFKM